MAAPPGAKLVRRETTENVDLDTLDISPELKEILRAADRDGDGRLTVNEIVLGLERAEQNRKGKVAARRDVRRMAGLIGLLAARGHRLRKLCPDQALRRPGALPPKSPPPAHPPARQL